MSNTFPQSIFLEGKRTTENIFVAPGQRLSEAEVLPPCVVFQRLNPRLSSCFLSCVSPLSLSPPQLPTRESPLTSGLQTFWSTLVGCQLLCSPGGNCGFCTTYQFSFLFYFKKVWIDKTIQVKQLPFSMSVAFYHCTR